MTSDESKKLRAAYHALEGADRMLEGVSAGIGPAVWRPIMDEVDQIDRDLPGLLPPFHPDQVRIGKGTLGAVYSSHGLRAYLGRVPGRIKVEIESTASSAGLPGKAFSFVSSIELREYRNLVHPGNELRTKLTVDAEEARISVAVLEMVHRDLARQ
jgi:hypothetical protein